MIDIAGTPHAFHFSPRTGWMNDPNGLIELNGVHHLFFQHNPEAPTPGRMHWGHATSRDLVTWTEHPVALTPGDEGDYDHDGCWSGCAVALPDGQVAMLYSAHRENRQLPALAVSADPDLMTWLKSPSNPVISRRPPVAELTDMRDHCVLAESSSWRQVLAAGRDTTLQGPPGPATSPDSRRGGLLLSYVSDGGDLTSWSYDGVLLDGRDADLPGEVWECPDVFAIDGATGTEAVVILSWYTKDTQPAGTGVSDVIWLTGGLRDGSFTPTQYGRLDLGDRFYAPQSYPTADGRRIMIGWLRTQADPSTVGRSSIGTSSLPRRLQVLNGQLRQTPAAELDTLVRSDAGTLNARSPAIDLGRPASALELTVSTGRPEHLAAVEVELTAAHGHVTVIQLAAFGPCTTWSADRGTWVARQSHPTQARILIDAGLIEIFTDDGRAAATSDLALRSVQRLALTSDPAGCAVSVAILTPAPRAN